MICRADLPVMSRSLLCRGYCCAEVIAVPRLLLCRGCLLLCRGYCCAKVIAVPRLLLCRGYWYAIVVRAIYIVSESIQVALHCSEVVLIVPKRSRTKCAEAKSNSMCRSEAELNVPKRSRTQCAETKPNPNSMLSRYCPIHVADTSLSALF